MTMRDRDGRPVQRRDDHRHTWVVRAVAGPDALEECPCGARREVRSDFGGQRVGTPGLVPKSAITGTHAPYPRRRRGGRGRSGR